MITAENLTRVYTMGRVEVHALAGVSLEVGRGEFVGIMGASGSGKSTLLHILGLLDRPTSGRVTIDEVDVLTLSDHQRTLFRLNRLGYVFQDYALIGELTALENVYLTSLVRGSQKRSCSGGAPRSSNAWVSATGWTTGRASSQAESSSGWRSRGRS